MLRGSANGKVGVLWHSLVSLATGYGISSRQIVLALDSLGVDVRLAYIWGTNYMEPPDEDERINAMRWKPKDLHLPQVVYALGDNFCKNSGRYRIGYTMLEVDGIPKDWVDQANFMDEVWVPSSFNRETFAASGVKRPIQVMPLGVSPQHFNPGVKSYKLNSRFTFLSIFEWVDRKAPDILLRAYTEEFSAADDVLLILKVSNVNPEIDVKREIAEMGLRKSGAPICVLYNKHIPACQLGSLYRSSDCFVLPSRGEGWCMPAMEAMACGLPVIVSDWSAQRDFINQDVAYPLRVAGVVPARARMPYFAGFNWAEPDSEHLRFLMRYVYEHPEEATEKGVRASQHVLTKWTWDKCAARIKQRLEVVQ